MSGCGRGRGWLNLNKTINRPGGISNTNASEDGLINGLNATTLNSQPSHYSNILALVEQLDLNDDGILLNQKLRSIVQSWTQQCNSNAEVTDCFNYIYSKCLQDSKLAEKLVTMISSYSFISTEIHNQKLRTLFINHIQTDFEGCRQLQRSNSVAFRNSVRMLGTFYHKARLADGRVIKFLAAPIVQYLEMLLDSSQPPDLELFTSQLYMNGVTIKTDCSARMDEILMRIRQILINNANLTQVCRTWMLLSLDVVSHRYSILPSELQRFYQDQLGEKAMANFQGTHSALSIQTSHANTTLDNYKSTVSVLQVTPPESASPVNEQTNNTQNDQLNLHSDALQNYNSSSFNCNSNDEVDKLKNAKCNTNNREKMGRPILGAGARLQRGRSAAADELNNSSWKNRDKENSEGWESWGSNSRKGPKQNKGWEHDDRFDKDY